MGLGVLMEKDNTVRQAGGFIIQLMPFADTAVIDRLEQNLGRIASVTSMLDQGMSPEEMLGTVLEGLSPEITQRTPAAFTCSCSKKRIEKVLVSLGEKELCDMIEDGQEIEVNCQFCGKNYRFTVEELQALYHSVKQGRASS